MNAKLLLWKYANAQANLLYCDRVCQTRHFLSKHLKESLAKTYHFVILYCLYYAIPEQKIVIVNSVEWHFNAFHVLTSQVVSFIFTLIQNRFHKANT